MTEAALQTKIDNADSNTSMSELLNMLHSAKEYSYHSLYDSAGLLPAADSANIGRLAFAEANDGMYVFVGMDSGWQLVDSDAETIVSSGPSSHIQGSLAGYSLAGRAGPSYTNVIQKYSYSSDGNATDVADATAAFSQHITTYSATDAFTHGGYGPSAERANVDKFNFSSGTDATDFGDHPGTGRYGGATSSPTHGYIHGGNAAASSYGAPGQQHITKFPHSAGTLSTTLVSGTGLSAVSRYNQTNASETHGYVSSLGPSDNKIEKYSFSTDGATTDVGDLLNSTDDGRGTHSGLMSDVAGGYGYVNSGYLDTTYDISRYPFASDGNAADVGDRHTDVWLGSVSASTTSGYMAGGLTPPPAAYINNIQKFTFASSSNATDVGDLLAANGYNGGAAN